MKKRTLAAVCIGAAACFLTAGAQTVHASDAGAPNTGETVQMAVPSVCGALKVDGTRLTDSSGNGIQLKGISTHGIGWYPDYINEECFRQLHEEWNVNVVRLAMYTAESGGYCTDGNQEKLKELMKAGVSCATENDMYVIIDWHILSDNDPNMYLDEAKDFFREMSSEFAEYENVLYEICNEPNGGTTWQDIRNYAAEIIPIIRENAEDAVILVGTPNWSQYVDQAAADPIAGYDNLMYVLHFYAATHKDELRNTMVSAIDAGLPVFVSEYGICDASGNGTIDEEQAEAWVRLMDEHGISYIAWNLSNKNETSAIISSTCTKTSGFEESDLSLSGQWLYQMLTGREISEEAREQALEQSGQKSFFCGDIEVTSKVVNSWEANGQFFRQYDLSLKNQSESACNGWKIQVSFDGGFELSDSWNGEYTAEGDTLYITNKDYNGSIPAGESIGAVGFIISGTKELKIK